MPENGVIASETTTEDTGPTDMETDDTGETRTSVSSITQGTATGKLDRALKILEPLLATQREEYKKGYVSLASTLLGALRDLRKRTTAVSRFDTSCKDWDYRTDPPEQRERSFIPHSLRLEIKINASSVLLNDSRCVGERNELVETRNAAADLLYKFKTDMAKHMRTAAELEERAYLQVLLSQYVWSLHTMADGVTKQEKALQGKSPSPVCLTSISYRATLDALSKLPEDHWTSCPFVSPGEKGGDKIQAIYTTLYGHLDEPDDHFHPPDRVLMEKISRRLTADWPFLTTKVWDQDARDASLQAVDADFAKEIAAQHTRNANDRVAEVVLENGTNTIEPTTRRLIEQVLRERESGHSKSLRKKSSGERATQRSTPGKNGTSKQGNSKQVLKGKSKKSSHPSSSGNTKTQGSHHPSDREDLANPRRSKHTSYLPRPPGQQAHSDKPTSAGMGKKHRARSRPRGDCNSVGNTNKKGRK